MSSTVADLLAGVLVGVVVGWALLLGVMQTGHLVAWELLLSAGAGAPAGVVSGHAWYTRRHPQTR